VMDANDLIFGRMCWKFLANQSQIMFGISVKILISISRSRSSDDGHFTLK